MSRLRIYCEIMNNRSDNIVPVLKKLKPLAMKNVFRKKKKMEKGQLTTWG